METERTPHAQQGYDAWIELWTLTGFAPRATECPARWMNDGEKRSQFIKGWIEAKREHERRLP